jgi:putative oxidoreductase
MFASEKYKIQELNNYAASRKCKCRNIAEFAVRVRDDAKQMAERRNVGFTNSDGIGFLGAGAAKLAGAESMVEQFEKIGIGQWFRYLTGAIEISGAVALLLGGTMVGAIFTHLFVFGNSPAAPLVLFVLLTIIIWARKDTVLQML